MKGSGINMNPSQKIGLTAVSLFAVSHLLPAYDTLPGFSCFQMCWRTMLELDNAWFYYSGFVFSNIMFSILVVALFVSKTGWRVRSIASFIILLHITSWSVLHLWGGLSDIKIGYMYGWRRMRYCLLRIYSKIPTTRWSRQPGRLWLISFGDTAISG